MRTASRKGVALVLAVALGSAAPTADPTADRGSAEARLEAAMRQGVTMFWLDRAAWVRPTT